MICIRQILRDFADLLMSKNCTNEICRSQGPGYNFWALDFILMPLSTIVYSWVNHIWSEVKNSHYNIDV